MNDTSARADSSPRLKAGASSAFCGEILDSFGFSIGEIKRLYVEYS